MTEDRVPTPEPLTDRIEQLVQYVYRMREPDIVRPDEEQSIRNIAGLIRAEAVGAPPLDVPPAYQSIIKALTYPCREPIHRAAAEALARLGSAPSRSGDG